MLGQSVSETTMGSSTIVVLLMGVLIMLTHEANDLISILRILARFIGGLRPVCVMPMVTPRARYRKMTRERVLTPRVTCREYPLELIIVGGGVPCEHQLGRERSVLLGNVDTARSLLLRVRVSTTYASSVCEHPFINVTPIRRFTIGT